MSQQPLALLRTVTPWERLCGASAPLGVTWLPGERAYNFALYSRHATGVTLLLYRDGDPVNPVFSYRMDPLRNKTSRIWHCWITAEMADGAAHYAYRVEGPSDPTGRNRFDSRKVLLDPFARAVYFPPGYDRSAACRPEPTDGLAPLGVLPKTEQPFEWSLAPPPRHEHDTIIYELHVKGFTARANSGVTPEHRGTFAGLVEKIPYLKELGVTVVELLPVHQFDPQEKNYWGYMTLNFFAPHSAYAGAADPTREFKRMANAFHSAGIEVWLDVVYNHTSEGGESGPTHSLRGICNQSYYLLQPGYGHYMNDTGCGNTLRCHHPAVRALVLSSLSHWARTMRVDGFRFDLASILARKSDGRVDTDSPPLVTEIGLLSALFDVRLVAEAWDIGSYLLGRGFPGTNWMQWNGKFRDDIRDFVRGQPGCVPALAQRLYGSDDLFPDRLDEAYRAFQSVNFVTAHDGFCLYDLVSYNHKHNLANGHGNTDGTDDNRSWNCGHEGDAGAPPEVLALRRRQVKNFFTLLMLANGVPMFCAGDEFLNTQGGNNNPYNQDNETTWLNWDLLRTNGDMFRFFREMIRFRKSHPSIARPFYWREDVSWYGVEAAPDFSHHSRSLAYCLRGARMGDQDIYVMVNGFWEDLTFHIQEGGPGDWVRIVDTAQPSPADFAEVPLTSLEYHVQPRSVVVLLRR
jgi:glycogen operon protein